MRKLIFYLSGLTIAVILSINIFSQKKHPIAPAPPEKFHGIIPKPPVPPPLPPANINTVPEVPKFPPPPPPQPPIPDSKV